MLNSLYTEAVRKKDSLSEILPEIKDKSAISRFWEEIPFSSSTEDFSIAAGDGSFNKKKFLAFNFYAVASESIIYDGELKKIDIPVIDKIKHHPFVDDLLRTYMGILELKSAIKSFENFDVNYYLYDGSIFGDLIRPFPTGADINKQTRKDILDTTLDELTEGVQYFNSKLTASKLIENYYKNSRDKFEYDIFISSIEKLILLKNLLKYNKRIIAVSKTSTNKDLFDSNVPDIAIFNEYTHKAGISKITTKKVLSEVKHVFPIENDFFKELEFTVFYVRLEDYKNVLKIELPYRASREDILNILQKIKKYSAGGYPYLLKKAHKDVVISSKDIAELAKIAKINVNEKIGREMLR